MNLLVNITQIRFSVYPFFHVCDLFVCFFFFQIIFFCSEWNTFICFVQFIRRRRRTATQVKKIHWLTKKCNSKAVRNILSQKNKSELEIRTHTYIYTTDQDKQSGNKNNLRNRKTKIKTKTRKPNEAVYLLCKKRFYLLFFWTQKKKKIFVCVAERVMWSVHFVQSVNFQKFNFFLSKKKRMKNLRAKNTRKNKTVQPIREEKSKMFEIIIIKWSRRKRAICIYRSRKALIKADVFTHTRSYYVHIDYKFLLLLLFFEYPFLTS